MDTRKYKKRCSRCGTIVEPDRYATIIDKILGGIIGFCGCVIGFCIGGPIGAVILAVVGYFVGLMTIMSIENDHDMNQWFKFKCPNCGCEWKEKIHTNDDPDDPSWMANAPY